jgi:hypothetical protein
MSTQVAGMSLTDAYPVLKEYYDSQPVRNLLERTHPFYSMVRKDTDFSGKYYPQPAQYGTSTGSADFNAAQTNQSPALNVEFMVPITTNYTLATVQNAALMASRNDKGAFLNVLKQSINGAMDNAVRRDAWQLFRNGLGTIGRIATGGITSGVITLASPTDALAFQRNQVVVASSSEGGALRAGIGYVISVDVSSGTVVVASSGAGGSAATPSGWAAGDYLYSQGDPNAAIQGLGAWLPAAGSTLRPVAGTAKVFLGVDRSVDPTRLAGTALNLSALDIESALIELISQVKMVGGNPDYVFTNPVSYRGLQKALQSRHQYTSVTVTNDAGITFPGIEVDNAIVLQDSDCPPQTAFALQMDTWKMVSYGKCPQILTYEDGITAFRTANNDSVEGRVGGYRNLVCEAPVRNGTAILPQ